MGGSAFSPELYTPRMSPAVYQQVRDHVIKTLSTHFKHVECPIEAPAKADYGDIDVLACEPFDKNSAKQVEEITKTETIDEKQLAVILGAKATKRSNELHFALPWPENLAVGTSPLSSAAEQFSQLAVSSSTISPARHIQLDLHICPTPTVYAWQLFRLAHGDFWTIVGSGLRRYGLSFRNSGLYICIADVERVNKKLSLIQLTNEPAEVLSFLFGDGVEGRFWRRDAFESVEGMCDFIRAECKFYRPRKEQETPGDEAHEAEMEVETQKNNRARFTKRSAFRYWLDVYLDQHSADDRANDFKGEYAGLSREEVAEMVKERFGVSEEYEQKQKTGLRQIGVAALWADIRAVVSPAVEGTEVNLVVRALRRRLSIESKDRKVEELDEAQRAYREGRFGEVKAWADKSWREVAEAKKRENEEKSRVNYSVKMQREREAREKVEADVMAKDGAVLAG